MQRKSYLSGMDWFVCAMDRRTRDLTGTGSYSQVALMLRGRLDAEVLRARLRSFLAVNPVLTGRCRRDPLTLAPYWAQSDGVECPDPLVELPWEDPGACSPLPPTLVDAVNQPLPARLRVAFTLSQDGERACLAMRFDHLVLDAGGAERLLRRMAAAEAPAEALPSGDRGLHLNRWREKFRSGQVANRALLGLRGSEPPVALPLPAARGGVLRSRFAFRTFSREQTDRTVECSERSVGYLQLLPYLLGTSVRAFHGLGVRRELAGGHYVVPVTLDARRAKTNDAVFFNQLSFHFYRFEAGSAGDPAALWRAASEQFYRQTRDRVADHLAQAGYLLRILPAAWLGRLMGVPLGGRLGSFSFALLAGDAFDATAFMGIPVEGVYHMPRVPAPPGIGVFFTRHQGRLGVVLSYLEGMLAESEAESLVDVIAAGAQQGE